MSSAAESILSDLVEVEQERTRRRTDPSFGGRVCAIKSFQQMRFRQTYADWLNSARYRRAAVFFLEELYGPMDFSQRDAQFARIVPSLVRLFPADVVEVVRTLARLHALSESLDSAMAAHLDDAGTLDAQSYVRAWVATGRASERSAQVELTVSTARTLDVLTGKALVRNSLRLMRTPARAAGLGQLQQFLESGFEAFKEMKGASEFIATLESRESALARELFAGNPSRLEAYAFTHNAVQGESKT